MADSSTTISSATRIIDLLRTEVRRRQPGDRLPSTRSLVDELNVSPVTVSNAVATLIAEGLVVTRPGAGSFVAEPPARPTPADYSWQTISLESRPINLAGMHYVEHDVGEEEISLSMGYLHPSLMPTKALSAALSRAARLPGAWERPPTSGIRPLRTWAAQLAGSGIDPTDVIITPGGQGSINTVLHAVVSPGDPLLVESPTYPGMMAAARTAGIRVVPVPMDRDGVVPELLADSFARTGARAFYCQPRFQNPTGAVLSPERRRAVLEVAGAAGAFVIEDDYARLLSHSPGAALPTLLTEDTDGRVIYITSLTKPVSPSLRIGAIISRGPVGARLRTLRVVDDMFVSRPLQEAAVELVSRPSWPRHLHTMSEALASRRNALARSVARYLPATQIPALPHGGYHLWLRLPAGADDISVAERAARRGVTIGAGSPYFPSEPPHPYLRLAFSAAPSETHLALAVERIAAAAPELT